MERPSDFYWRTLLGLPKQKRERVTHPFMVYVPREPVGLPLAVSAGKLLNAVILWVDGRTNGGLGKWL